MFTLKSISFMIAMHWHYFSCKISVFFLLQTDIPVPWMEYWRFMLNIKFTFIFIHFSASILPSSSFTGVGTGGGVFRSEILLWNQFLVDLQFHAKTHQVLPSSSAKSGWAEASILLSNSSSMVTTRVTTPSEVGRSEGVSWSASSGKICMTIRFLYPSHMKAHLVHCLWWSGAPPPPPPPWWCLQPPSSGGRRRICHRWSWSGWSSWWPPPPPPCSQCSCSWMLGWRHTCTDSSWLQVLSPSK